MDEFQIQNKKLLHYSGSDPIVEIPDGIVTIAEGCFCDCTAMQKVIIPNSVRYIEDHAFENCTDLKEIQLPHTITSIGKYAFSGCISLENRIKLLPAVSYLGDYAFLNCEKIPYVLIYGSINIGEGVFMGCKSLTHVTAYGEVTYSSTSAFEGCDQFRDRPIVLDEFIIKQSFGDANYRAVKYTGKGTVVSIPDGIVRLEDGLFENQTGITEVYIPDSVKHIGCSVFKNCRKLTHLELPTSIETIGSYAFWGCISLNPKVCVPASVLRRQLPEAFEGCPVLERTIYEILNPSFSEETYPYAHRTLSVEYSRKNQCWGTTELQIVIQKKATGIFVGRSTDNCLFSISSDEFENVLRTLFDCVRVSKWDAFYLCPSVLDSYNWELTIRFDHGEDIHSQGYARMAPKQDILERCLQNVADRSNCKP